jgi:hypothetical protein
MALITNHHSRSVTKCLLIGHSGSGKTGALASLASAGYRLRVIDLDNGLDILRGFLTDPSSSYVKKDPNIAKHVSYVTLTEPMKNINGQLVPSKATVWKRMTDMLSHWKDGDEDLGPVTSWGPDDILAIDSFSMASSAALNWHLALNGALGRNRTQNEARRDIGEAQRLLRSLLEMLYDESVRCNVVVTGHITLVTENGLAPQSDEAVGPVVGFPAAIGRALSPHIPRYFNSVLLAQTSGAGSGARHRIYTRTQGVVNAKTSAPLRVAPDYPLESGLADYFKAVRGDGSGGTSGSTS